MENDLKGNENYFELTGGSSYGGFELLGVDCMTSSVRLFPFVHKTSQCLKVLKTNVGS